MSGLNPKCVQAFNYSEIKTYFERLMKVIRDNNIPWENIYNMDEKGIQLGGGWKGDGQKYFISHEERGFYVLRSANLKLVTVIESCCAAPVPMGPHFCQGLCSPGSQLHWQTLTSILISGEFIDCINNIKLIQL